MTETELFLTCDDCGEPIIPIEERDAAETDGATARCMECDSATETPEHEPPRVAAGVLLDALGDVLGDDAPESGGPRTLSLDRPGVDAWIDYDTDGAHVEADLRYSR